VLHLGHPDLSSATAASGRSWRSKTSTFWQNHGESNDVDPSTIQTEVFRLPSTCFADVIRLAVVLPESGSFGDQRIDNHHILQLAQAANLPSTCFAEEDGSIANSGRWLQWHWKGQDAPGEARRGSARKWKFR
jgi:formate dehydrogenase-N alpha subunit